MYNRGRMKVVGAINYKINNIVYEHCHWVISQDVIQGRAQTQFYLTE